MKNRISFHWVFKALCCAFTAVSFQVIGQPAMMNADSLGKPDRTISFTLDLSANSGNRVIFKEASDVPAQNLDNPGYKNCYREDPVAEDGGNAAIENTRSKGERSNIKVSTGYAPTEDDVIIIKPQTRADDFEWAIYGRIAGFVGGDDSDNDGYYSTFSFNVGLDCDGPGGYVWGKLICNTTGNSWWLKDPDSKWLYVARGDATDYKYWEFNQDDFDFSKITGHTTLDFTAEIWNKAQTSRLAQNNEIVGETEIKVEPPAIPWTVYGKVVNFNPTQDVDNDGYYEAYSFDLGIDPNGPGGYAIAKAICTTTNTSWFLYYNNAPFYVEGNEARYYYWSFNQDDFPQITGNSVLDFTVELWNTAKTSRYCTQRRVTNETSLKVDYAIWSLYSKITDFEGLDFDGNGFYSSFSFKVGLKAKGTGEYVYGKLICTTTNDEKWLASDTNGSWLVSSAYGDWKYWDFTHEDFTITSQVSMDFKVELWNSRKTAILATATTVTGEPIKAEPSDVVTVTVTASDETAGESGTNYGSGAFLFTRTGMLDNSLTVDITVSGTATAGLDYNEIGTTITFPAGEANVSKTITVKEDTLIEDDETVIVTLKSNDLYRVGDPASATVTIKDRPTVSVTATDGMAGEPNTGFAEGVFTFTRTDTTVPLVVYYTVSGTATSGIDYTSIGNSIAFSAGASSVIKTISVIDDALTEDVENVIVTIDSNDNYNVSSTEGSATIIIHDDDVKPAVSIQASDAMAGGTDNVYGNGSFIINRYLNTSGKLSVYFSVAGTALAGTHYTAIGTSVTFEDKETSKEIQIIPLNLSSMTANKTVIVSLNSNADYSVGMPSSATVSIIKPEQQITITPSISGSDFYLSESTYTVNCTISYNGSVSTYGLGFHLNLPSGWSFKSSTAVSASTSPRSGDINSAEWTWSNVPASPISFEVVLNVPADASGAKSITGYAFCNSISYPCNTLQTDTENAPLFYHPADTSADMKISEGEYASYKQPVFNVLVNGEDGAYEWDGTTLNPMAQNDANETLFHPADENEDQAISAREYTRYKRPLLHVLINGCDGSYEWNGVTLTAVSCDNLRGSLEEGTRGSCSVTRTVEPSVYTPDSQLTVTLYISSADELTEVFIEESIPAGWSFVSADNGGVATVNGTIIFDVELPVPATVSYVIAAPEAPETEYTLSAKEAFCYIGDEMDETDIAIAETKLFLENEIPAEITYGLTVENGTGSGSYTAGTEVEIVAEPMENQLFDHWEATAGVIADANAVTSTFTMPAQATTVTAVCVTPTMTRSASPNSFTASGLVNVTLELSNLTRLENLFVQETIPEGWSVVEIENHGYQDDNRIVFDLSGESISTTLAYTLRAPENPANEYALHAVDGRHLCNEHSFQLEDTGIALIQGYEEWPEDANAYAPSYGRVFTKDDHLAINFSWPQITWATAYVLEVKDYSGSVIFKEPIAETSWVLEGWSANSYLWSVTATDGGVNALESSTFAFSVLENDGLPVIKKVAGGNSNLVFTFAEEVADAEIDCQLLFFSITDNKWLSSNIVLTIQNGKATVPMDGNTDYGYLYIRSLLVNDAKYVECFVTK